jgi:hypothetical protein
MKKFQIISSRPGEPVAPERARRPSLSREKTPEAASGSGEPPPLDPEALELINEYFYGVRIYPGQDTNLVYIGWVTTQYHIHSMDFTHDLVRVCTIQKLDSYGGIQERLDLFKVYLSICSQTF